MGKFRIDFRVRLVAACGNIKVMKANFFGSGLNYCAEVSAVTHLAEADFFNFAQRMAGNGCHPMIAFLATDLDMIIAKSAQRFERKQIIGALGFLKAKHVRLVVLQKLLNKRHAQAHGIDIPSSNGKNHGRDSRQSEDGREPKQLSYYCNRDGEALSLDAFLEDG